MNQFLIDELNCVSADLRKKKLNPRFYCGNEINIIGDENALSAYLAGYNMSVLKPEDNGKVNVISEGTLRYKEIYDEINAEYGNKNCMKILEDYDAYLENSDKDKIKRF